MQVIFALLFTSIGRKEQRRMLACDKPYMLFLLPYTFIKFIKSDNNLTKHGIYKKYTDHLKKKEQIGEKFHTLSARHQ